MMEKLMSQCEAALMSGVLVTKENIFQVVNSNSNPIFVTWNIISQLAKISLEYSCYSRPAETILAKCARFLKMEISRNFGVLKLLGKDDYEIFQVELCLEGWSQH